MIRNQGRHQGQPIRCKTRRLIYIEVMLSSPMTGAFWFESLFAPDAELWPRWERHNPESQKRIDHTEWDTLLKTYVRQGPDGVNRFAYSRLSAFDAQQLHGYVRRLADIKISDHSRPEQFAYWINLYNALTIQVVISHYPVKSIREIKLEGSGLGGGPWEAKLVTVEGENLSLNDIEHRILRPIWRDPGFTTPSIALLSVVPTCARTPIPEIP